MTRFISLFFVLLTSIVFQTEVNAQCDCNASNYASINVAGWVPGQTGTITTCQWGEERSTIFNTVAGAVYRVFTCGDTDFDTQLSIYTTGCGYIGYNDDFCGLQSQVTFTSPGGNLYSVLNRYFCGSQTTCMTVQIQLISLPTPPCSVQGNPAVFGSNTWNVYVYDGNNFNTYSGYYVENNLSFNSANRWGTGGTPSSASGYLGCPVGNDNHSFIYKRQGFPAGFYSIDVGRDDDYLLYVNGSLIYSGGCCGTDYGIWTGYLDGTSQVEIRFREYGGGSYGAANMNNWLSAGTLYSPGSVTTCSSTIYDYMGPSADYLNSSDGYTVLNPTTPGGKVILSGSINTEGCCDFVYIYNGTGTGSLIWSGSGNQTIPTIVSTAANGALTVRFTTDGSVTAPGFALNVDCCTPLGDQTSYGSNQWLGYVYHNDNFTEYAGYVTEANDFDQTFGGDYAQYSTNGCQVYTETFSVRYKNTRNFPCGIYRFRLRGDDGHRISIDGGATWLGEWWYGQGWGDDHYTPYVYLNGNVNLVLEYFEGGGGNRVTLWTESITPTVSASINQGASGTLCAGSTLNLDATGSSNYGPFSFSWSGPGGYTASGASMSRANAAAGTYTLTVTHACGQTATDTYVLTTNTPPTAPTGISGTTSICGGSTTLTATGGSNGSGATYQWYAGGCGSGSLLGTGASITVSPSSNTTYYVRRVASGANACTNTTGCWSQLVTVNTPPTANAGVDQSQCNTNPFTISGATISGSGTLNNWTFNVDAGTATVSGTGSLNGPTITPTSGTGQVTMTLNVTGTGGCANTSDQMVFEWSASPTATAGPDITQCGNAAVSFTGSSASSGSTVSWTNQGGTGTGIIITGSGSDPTTWGFTPTSASGSLTFRLTSVPPAACSGSNITDDLVFTWDEAPSVSTTSPQNSCTGDAPFTISGASASGNGDLTWNLTSVSGTASITSGGATVSPTFDPTTTSGQYSLEIVSDGNGGCEDNGNDASAIMTVNWANPPVANAGSDYSACEGTAQSMSGASISGGPASAIAWTQTGGTAKGSFTTSPPTNPSLWVYTPTSAGTAILELAVTGSGSICGSTIDYDYVTITFDPLPILNAGTDLDVCYGSGAIAMTGASASNISGYTWSGGDPTFGSWSQAGSVSAANFTPIGNSGSFLAQLTVNGNGACSTESFSDTRTIDWSETPVAIAGAATTTCGNAPHIMVGAVASGTYSSISWSGNPNGTWTTTHPTDPSQWVFTPSTPSGSFTSTLTVTGSGACLGTNPTATRLITWSPGPTVDAGSDIDVCSGAGTITMTGASTSNISSYSWSNFDPSVGAWNQGVSAPSAAFTPAIGAGQILATLTVNGTGACSALSFSDSRIITWNSPPTISSITSTNVTDCSNDNGVISVNAVGNSPFQYSYDNGSSYVAFNTQTNLGAGSYNVIVIDDNNCTTSYVGNPVVIDPPSLPVVTVTAADANCNGAEDGQVTVTVTSGGTASYAIDVASGVKSYKDTTNAIGETATFNVVAGTYNITITDRFGCTTNVGPYTISEPPIITVSTTVVNNTNCTGTDGQITVNASGGSPGFTYSFNGGGFSGTNVFSNLGSGDYPIIVRDNNGCEIPFEETIGGPFDANAGIDRYICAGTSFTMNAQLDVNAVTVAGGGSSNYALSSIDYVPRSPSWTPVSLGDDQVSGFVGIGFPFTFYGNTYSNVRISSNGFITFNNDANSGCCTGQFVPNGGAPNNIIALCWEDLNPNNGGTIQYGVFGTAPNRIFVVEYSNIQHFGGGNPVTGQIQLYESTNNIEIHNDAVNADGGGNTQGIENATGSLATTSHNSQGNWTETNSAYLFQPPYDLTTINYTWSPSTGLSNPNILNPTVSGLTNDITYTLQVEMVGICTIDDEMTVYVSDLVSTNTPTDVVCNGDDDGCISVVPTSGEAPYLIEGPNGEIRVYDGRMKELTVSNNVVPNQTLTDYQVKMTVAYTGQMRADFADLRFYDGTPGNLGDILPYYIESYSLSNNAVVYVKVPNVPTGGTTLYMTYGNPALSSQSDPDNTFWWYEDMQGTPSGALINNATYIDHQFVRLTQAFNSQSGQLRRVQNISTGGNGYVTDFEFWIGGGNGADGLWLYSDADNPGNGYISEDQNHGGYVFAYDTWQNEHQIKHNGVTYGTNFEANHDNATWRTGRIEQFNTTGRMYLDGVMRLERTNLPNDNVGDYFGFGCRTGGANNEHRIRNVRVRKLVSPEPTVTFGSEQLPDNQFCDLPPGTYTVSVWDVAECNENESNIPIAEPTVLTIDNIDITDTWCYVTNNGELEITVSGGTPITPAPAYLYNWAGPAGFSSNNEDLTGLSPGVYNVTVADDNACTASSSATVGTSTPITSPSFTWTGMTDQFWQDPTNWDCGVPDATSDVIIPASPIGGNTPLITGGVIGDVFHIRVLGNIADLLKIDSDSGSKLRVHEP